MQEQFTRYMVHIARNVGGIMLTPKMMEESGPVYETVSEAKQKEAVDYLNKNLFTTPSWLLNSDILNRTGLTGTTFIGQPQDAALNRLLSSRTLTKLIDAEAASGNSVYQVTELLADLKKGILSELATARPTDIYRRNLQKSYVNILIGLLSPPIVTTLAPGITISSGGISDKSDAKSIIKGYLTSLRTEMTGAATRTTDLLTKYHWQDLADRINKALNPKN